MNQELKAKWVAALRSGNYKQAQGKLQDGDALCCLGVLREIVTPGSTESRGGQNQMPVQAVINALGIPLYVGDSDALIAAATFSEMNDSGKSFSEIADAIEAAQ